MMHRTTLSIIIMVEERILWCFVIRGFSFIDFDKVLNIFDDTKWYVLCENCVAFFVAAAATAVVVVHSFIWI